jgi:hypothetical protein
MFNKKIFDGHMFGHRSDSPFPVNNPGHIPPFLRTESGLRVAPNTALNPLVVS